MSTQHVRRTKTQKSRPQTRRLFFEPLEHRMLLSVGAGLPAELHVDPAGWDPGELAAPDRTVLASGPAGITIDHNDTDLTVLSEAAVNQAKAELHIAYGHTSHGSQVTTGMTGLVGFINGGGLGLSYPANLFAWNDGGTSGALDLHDYAMPGDLGHSGDLTWATETRTYLNNPANSDVNVIMWSWCGGVSDNTEAGINIYLSAMNQLEIDYSHVSFVYMTGHLDGEGLAGNLHVRNEQIRAYCRTYGKILYDFADIETYDPDGTYYGDKIPNDNCDYDSDGNGSRDRNWALDWAAAHTQGVDWYNCASAHSQAVNANQKAYAAWALWTQLAAQLDAGDTPGLYDPGAAVFHLKNSNANPPAGANATFRYGPAGNRGWQPIAGDWDGNGSNSVGLYDPSIAGFHLKNTNANPPAGADVVFRYGPAGNRGWQPLAGDWDGDGIDTVGLYDPSTAGFHLKNSNTQGGGADVVFTFGPKGNRGWIPIAGDWNHDGRDSVGLYDPGTGGLHLKNSNTSVGGADVVFRYGPAGNRGWWPLAGDWNQDGIDTVGLYDPSVGGFHLKNSNSPGGGADAVFTYGPGGNRGWTPMAGDWNGPSVSPSRAAASEPARSDAAQVAQADLLPTLAEAFSCWDTTGSRDESSAVDLAVADLAGLLPG